MKPKFLSVLTLLGFMIIAPRIFAQIDSSKIHHISAYIKHIDSLIENKKQTNISTLIIDGTIIKKFIVTPKGGGKPRSFYMTIGGYSEEIFSNKRNRDTIYKAENNAGLGYYFHEMYYYENNKLIAAHIIVKNQKKYC